MHSWLLQDPQMKPRQYYKPYLDRVEKYFTQLLGPLKNLQFAKGGPIVALQVGSRNHSIFTSKF